MSVQKYPLDFEALEKGSWISAAEMSSIFGVSPDHSSWGFRVMSLVGRIHDERPDLIARQQGGQIRICDDHESSDYAQSRIDKSRAKLCHWAGMRARVDKSALDPVARSIAESRDRYAAGLAQAVTAQHRKTHRLRCLRGPIGIEGGDKES